MSEGRVYAPGPETRTSTPFPSSPKPRGREQGRTYDYYDLDAPRGRAGPARVGMVPVRGGAAPFGPPRQLPAIPPLQAKLEVGAVDDPLEKEADRVADRVMRAPEGEPVSEGRAASSREGTLQRKCSTCAEEEKIQRKAEGAPAGGVAAPPIVHHALESPGESLDGATRAFLEPRFGRDLADVRVHTGAQAAASAAAVRARAVTVGRDIVFGAGQYSPRSAGGRWLLAHELAHVAQSAEGAVPSIRRCPDAASTSEFDGKATAIKARAEYTGLDAPTKSLTDQILTDARAKDKCIYFADKLKLLFDTKDSSTTDVAARTQASTRAAAKAERGRLSAPVARGRTGLEERASSTGRTWTRIPGKFGGGAFFVDKTDPLNIVVKADVMLNKLAGVTDDNVTNIKSMEDAIEKAASTKGYLVDITFVDTAGPDTFQVNVNPGGWEDATNWGGGDPTGFAHELHHLFAFELDRYDYIESHAGNADMLTPNRLYWFSQEMTKPAGFNNPASLMGGGPHPRRRRLHGCRVGRPGLRGGEDEDECGARSLHEGLSELRSARE